MNLPRERVFIHKILSAKKTNTYVKRNLRQSLASVGFSQGLISDLLRHTDQIDIEAFGRKHASELYKTYTINFFQKITQKYFTQYVLPEIPPSEKLLDLGCGPGFFAHTLARERRFLKVIGVDIIAYPEWKQKNTKISFVVIPEGKFPRFIGKVRPDSVVLTWSLHHMHYGEQKRYARHIYNGLAQGARVIILDDSWSNKESPETGIKTAKSFFEWSPQKRKEIMSVYDWVANRILAQRKIVPVPFAYRTLEEWSALFQGVGFHIQKRRFIGFPRYRDINTPQSLLVMRKLR